jgi:hypothetical protein
MHHKRLTIDQIRLTRVLVAYDRAVATVSLDPNLGARPPSQACPRPAVKFVLANAMLQSGALRFTDSNHLPRMRLGQFAPAGVPAAFSNLCEIFSHPLLSFSHFRPRERQGGLPVLQFVRLDNYAS